jgi:hypothetical protein
MSLCCDTHLPLTIQLPVLPFSCQLEGREVMGVGRMPGQLGNRPHPSLARLCLAHNAQVNLIPARAAERLGGGKGEAHREGVTTVGLSITHSSQRG